MSEESKSHKKGGFRKFFSIQNVVVIILVILFIMQYVQFQRIIGDFSFLEERDSSLITEIGQLKQTYSTFGEDLNEIRTFLRMPSKNYAGLDEEMEIANEETDKNKDQVQLALFKYMDYLSADKKISEKTDKYRSFLNGLIESTAFSDFLTNQNLIAGEISEDDHGIRMTISDEKGTEMAVLYIDKADGVFYRKTVKVKEEINPQTAADFESELMEFIRINKTEVLNAAKEIEETVTAISEAISSEEVQAAIAEKGITLEDSYVEENLSLTWSILNKTNELSGEIVYDTVSGSVTLIDKSDESMTTEVTDIKTALAPFLNKLNTSTFIEQKVTAAKEQVENTINDDGFNLLLQESGLSVAMEAREDEDRYYYDITDPEGTHISSIVVEKSTGVINIVDPDGANSENLLFFDPDFKKKTLTLPDEVPEYGDQASHEDGTFNILIAGKHGNLVDTMIFTHIDENKGEIRMISIPRDLHYNGRKINAFPYFYGMPELKKRLSDITGYELDKYILIDMYAFIDVIDLLGGIDVHLNSPVIDPTYRTVDNGVVGTLHYEPGDYHLGGKEALRLARSRHTSSDFARAERQQLILEALQDKARNFGFGDADTIYELAKTVLNKTETDINLDEAIAYYFRYQNYDIISNNVMSSGNVLYVPPYITVENCNNMIAAAKAAGQPIPGCMNENHAYTLVPRGNNWNIIKWYFRENFENIEEPAAV